MFDIFFALFAGAMAIWRTVTYFSCYDPATGLFTRSFVHFTLPNIITAVVGVLAIVAVLRVSHRPTHGWTPKEDGAGGFLLFLSGACLLLTTLGCVMLILFGQMTFFLTDLLLVAMLLVHGAFAISAMGYAHNNPMASSVSTMSLVNVVCVLVSLLTSFISSTEMAVVEEYMYHLLVLCGAALYFLAIARSLLIQAHMGIALWYGRLLLYFALMEYIPKGIYLLAQGSVLLGVRDVAIAVGIALLTLGVSRSASIVYLTEEELADEEQDEE